MKTYVAAAAAFLLAAGTAASAATFTLGDTVEIDPEFEAHLQNFDPEKSFGGNLYDGYLTLTGNTDADVGNDGVAVGYVEFFATHNFALTYDDASNNSDGGKFGFTIDYLNPTTNAYERIAPGSNPHLNGCGSISGVLQGDCFILTGGLDQGLGYILEGTELGIFQAGEYRLGYVEGSNDPDSNQASFGLNVVPVPASAFLLLAGLGGLGAMKRRKKA